MESLVRSILIIVTAVAIALAIAFSGGSLEGKEKKRSKTVAASASIVEMDPIGFLKRFQNDASTRNYKAKKGISKTRDVADPIGPNIIWFLTQMCARFSPSRSAAPWEEGADALVPANQR